MFFNKIYNRLVKKKIKKKVFFNNKIINLFYIFIGKFELIYIIIKSTKKRKKRRKNNFLINKMKISRLPSKPFKINKIN